MCIAQYGQWDSVLMFIPLAVPPCKGVIHSLERSKPFSTRVIMSYSNIFLYYTNSVLMFYFILFNISIKCAHKNEELYKNI